MSGTDELLKTAEKNLSDAKAQYKHAQQVAGKSGDTTLLDVMKANYENARRNFQNVKNLAQLESRSPITTTDKPKDAVPTVLPKKTVDPNAVELPGSAAMIYFPTMDKDLASFVKDNKKNSDVAKQADQWQTDAIRESSRREEHKVARHHDNSEQVTLTREQYRKQLKKKK